MTDAFEPEWTTLAGTLTARTERLEADEDTAFLWHVNRHGIAPLLDQFVHTGKLTGLSPCVTAALHSEALEAGARDLAQNAATVKLLNQLGKEGLDVLVLKGAALAQLHYPHSWLRTRADTDLWIRPADANRVAGALQAAGYVIVNLELAHRSRKQFQAAREALNGERLWFDIHYRLSNRGVFHATLDFDECRDSAQELPTLGGRAPDDVHLLLHACVHRVAHGRNLLRDRLLWLWDIHLLFEALDEKQRSRFTERALAKAIGSLCADALTVCRHGFETDVNEETLDALASRRDQEPSAALIHAGKWGWAWSDFRHEKGWRDKSKFTLELLANQLR